MAAALWRLRGGGAVESSCGGMQRKKGRKTWMEGEERGKGSGEEEN